MARIATFVLLVVAGAGLSATVLATPFSGGSCGAVPVQDDAASGKDAPNARPIALRIVEDANYTGRLEPAVVQGVTDTQDWYAVQLPGTGEDFMAQTGNYATVTLPESTYLLYIDLEAWAPGATTPTRFGTTNAIGGEDLRLDDNAVAGIWHIRVSLVPVVAQPAPCANAESSAAAGLEDVLQNYTLYLGCNPHCITVEL